MRQILFYFYFTNSESKNANFFHLRKLKCDIGTPLLSPFQLPRLRRGRGAGGGGGQGDKGGGHVDKKGGAWLYPILSPSNRTFSVAGY